MGLTTEDLLLGSSQPDNFIARLEAVERRLRINENAEPLSGPLSGLSSDLGDIVAGTITMGNGQPLGEGFTGLYQSATQFEWPEGSGQFWNFGGFNTDALQVGIDALTGKLLAAGGAMTVGVDAINIDGIGYAIIHTATVDSETRTMRYGMTTVDGVDVPVGQILYTAPEGTNEITDNPDFESGDFTGWTDTDDNGGTWSVETTNPHDGTYSAVFTSSGGFGIPTLESDKYSVTPSTFYQASGWQYSTGGTASFSSSIRVAWYTSGDVLIREDGVGGIFVLDSWFQRTATLLSPSNAAKASIIVQGYNGSAGRFDYFDDFSLAAQTTTSSLLFRPYVTIMGPLEMTLPDDTPADPTDPYMQIYLTASGINFSSPTGTRTNGLIRRTDHQAFVSGSGGTWTCPDSIQGIMILAVGGGGGGGGGASQANGTNKTGGGGGGGGGAAFMVMSSPVEDLTITLGSQGVGGTGGTNANGTAGTDGGDTTVVGASSGKTYLTAGGGKGGPGGQQATNNTAGGAGGSAGGLAASAGNGSGFTGGGGGPAAGGPNPGFCAEYGGGGGGSSGTLATAGAGGSSVFGPAGGGGGGAQNAGTQRAGGAGGISCSGTPGGGGTGGTTGGGNGQGDAAGSPNAANAMGTGGGGGGANNAGAGGNGGEGGAPTGSGGGNPALGGGGGGGGGGGATQPATQTGGDGGGGGKGSVIIISW